MYNKEIIKRFEKIFGVENYGHTRVRAEYDISVVGYKLAVFTGSGTYVAGVILHDDEEYTMSSVLETLLIQKRTYQTGEQISFAMVRVPTTTNV